MKLKLEQPIRWLQLILISVWLSACGGGKPNQTPLATNDSASVAWNVSSPVVLLSNDTDPDSDKLSIASVTQPGHGQAVLTGGQVSYQPVAGYFGSDSFSYTISDGKGHTSTAQVALTVQATLQLKGVVRDGPLPGAVVTATVGSQTVMATADAAGQYVLTVVSSNPADFLTLTAQGAGAQSQVKLQSLGGDLSTLAAQAASDGSVVATSAPTLNVTHVSTALAALATAANGGVAPSTQATLATASAQINPDALVQMAAAIQLVVDQGVPLPSGIADTAALVANATAYSGFVSQQLQTNAAALQTASASVLNDPALVVPAPSSLVASTTRIYHLGQGCCTTDASEVTLNPDGSASVLSGINGQVAATWTVDAAGVLNLVYTSPIVTGGFSAYTDASGNQYPVVNTETGQKIRQISGTPSGGVVAIQSVGTVHYPGGQWPDEPFNATAVTMQFAQASAFAAPTVAELTSASYGGIPTLEIGPTWSHSQDVLVLNADGTGQLNRTGQVLTWTRTDAMLTLTYTNGWQQQVSRMAKAADGEERWLVRLVVGGQTEALVETMVVKVTSELAFSNDGLVNRWRSYVNAGTVTDYTFFINLHADGTMTQESDFLNGQTYGQTPAYDSWALVNGEMQATRYQHPSGYPSATCPAGSTCPIIKQRTWTRLATSGAKVFVMEHLFQINVIDQWRINRYEATAPAVVQAATNQPM